MPDHVHLLTLPTAIQHDMAVFENDMRGDFTCRVLTKPNAPAPRPFRVREKSGARGHRFWQCRAYNEVVLTPKGAIAKMRFCEFDPVHQGVKSNSSTWRWTNFIKEAQLSEMWAALRSRQKSISSLNSEAQAI
jgi:hypothetical protein